ncbi:hypothetical protein CkaCkLH20_03960 [Colletotrichum karsti]|uniref:Fungal N-terminal domain-containing protein n=1 Tax=Colletotrichum karsti TaxID=1095194 RepID=A0A9P6I719_9PEZI|nr:uncharacterized protein CkaCkLH20_03960 [Colletotrichum karsti]KAF9878468.1 hypothetical protein CkaCkLH20_03960 [Colletotrichum karsti]
MAEIFGTVASAIAVAELFTKSAFKIKKLWDEVKDVPDDIQRLLKQLDEVRLILDTVAAASTQHQYLIHGSATASVLQSCQDWKLIWDPATEEFARDFWQLVENPKLHVPGEWLSDSDEFDDSDSSYDSD